jgi:hypothetical protein
MAKAARAPQIRVGGEVVGVAAARSGAVAGRTHRWVAHDALVRERGAAQNREGGEVIGVAAAQFRAVVGRTHRVGSLTMRWSANVGLR